MVEAALDRGEIEVSCEVRAPLLEERAREGKQLEEAAVLDSDTLSLLARGDRRVIAVAREYLARHGRFTLTSISVFERLRGYHAALRKGRPYESQLRSFKAFVATSVVLPLDTAAAERAARIWAAVGGRTRHALGDILIAAIASVKGLPLVTRNRRDLAPILGLDFARLRILDWARRG